MIGEGFFEEEHIVAAVTVADQELGGGVVVPVGAAEVAGGGDGDAVPVFDSVLEEVDPALGLGLELAGCGFGCFGLGESEDQGGEGGGEQGVHGGCVGYWLLVRGSRFVGVCWSLDFGIGHRGGGFRDSGVGGGFQVRSSGFLQMGRG